MTLTFEDFPVGRLGTYGPRHVTREEILAFAAEFADGADDIRRLHRPHRFARLARRERNALAFLGSAFVPLWNKSA